MCQRMIGKAGNIGCDVMGGGPQSNGATGGKQSCETWAGGKDNGMVEKEKKGEKKGKKVRAEGFKRETATVTGVNVGLVWHSARRARTTNQSKKST